MRCYLHTHTHTHTLGSLIFDLPRACIPSGERYPRSEETAVQQQQSTPLSEVTLVAEVPEQQEQQASTHSSSHPAPLERSTSLANALSGIEDVGALLSHDNRPPPPRASTAFPLAASASSSSSSSSLLSSSSSFTLERSTTVPVQEFKIIVVGDANTGKTSLIHRYVLKQFQSVYKTTVRARRRCREPNAAPTPESNECALAVLTTGHEQIGVDFASRIVTVNGQYSVSVQLWDICGMRERTRERTNDCMNASILTHSPVCRQAMSDSDR